MNEGRAELSRRREWAIPARADSNTTADLGPSTTSMKHQADSACEETHDVMASIRRQSEAHRAGGIGRGNGDDPASRRRDESRSRQTGCGDTGPDAADHRRETRAVTYNVISHRPPSLKRWRRSIGTLSSGLRTRREGRSSWMKRQNPWHVLIETRSRNPSEIAASHSDGIGPDPRLSVAQPRGTENTARSSRSSSVL
jgi:hypothetical protein